MPANSMMYCIHTKAFLQKLPSISSWELFRPPRYDERQNRFKRVRIQNRPPPQKTYRNHAHNVFDRNNENQIYTLLCK